MPVIVGEIESLLLDESSSPVYCVIVRNINRVRFDITNEYFISNSNNIREHYYYEFERNGDQITPRRFVTEKRILYTESPNMFNILETAFYNKYIINIEYDSNSRHDRYPNAYWIRSVSVRPREDEL
ncbi:hypothetical protein [Hydrogenobaculum acidophilum]